VFPTLSLSGASGPAEPPHPDDLGGCDDGMDALYVALSDLREQGVASGNALVLQNQDTENQERAAEQAALQRAQADQPGSGSGFFASIGAAVSDFVGDVAHGHIGEAFSDAGRDLSRGWNSPHFWGDLGKIFTDVTVISTAVAEAAPVLGPVAGPVEAVAEVTTAVASAGEGLARLRTGQFAADAENAQADAAQAQDQLSLLSTREHDALSDLSNASQVQQGALAELTQAIETNDDTRVTAASFRVRG
jgi:hypothetical protein